MMQRMPCMERKREMYAVCEKVEGSLEQNAVYPRNEGNRKTSAMYAMPQKTRKIIGDPSKRLYRLDDLKTRRWGSVPCVDMTEGQVRKNFAVSAVKCLECVTNVTSA
jgi:hypothetical protein